MLFQKEKAILKNNHLIMAVFLITLFLMGGTVGYMAIEGYSVLQGLFMTVITITTVGFGLVKPLSAAGTIFTIVLIFLGFVLLAFFGQVMLGFLFQKALTQTLGMKKMERQIMDLENHYIVCGYGRVGEAAVDYFLEASIRFLIIELDVNVAKRLRERGFLVLEGSATDEELLLKGGIKRAKGVLVLTNSESENLYITLTSRELNPIIYIIARGENKKSERKLKRAGADAVISPYSYAGAQVAENILIATGKSNTIAHPFGENHSTKWLEIDENSELVGRSLSEASSEKKWKILGIRRKKRDRLYPPDSLRIKKHDFLLIEEFDFSNAYERISRPKRILIVEDNLITANLYTRLLRREGYLVNFVTDGREAVEFIQREKPDVAVIDNMLPAMSGIDVCRKVRSNPDTASVYLILFTGDEHPETRQRALTSGADDFLLKTSEATELIGKIKKAFGHLSEFVENDFMATAGIPENEGKLSEDYSPTTFEEDRNLNSIPKALNLNVVPIKIDEALERCGNDWEFLKTMFSDFIEYLPEQLNSIREAVRILDFSALESEAHRLKGAAANFGAQNMVDYARVLEESARSGSVENAEEICQKMEDEFRHLSEFQENLKNMSSAEAVPE